MVTYPIRIFDRTTNPPTPIYLLWSSVADAPAGVFDDLADLIRYYPTDAHSKDFPANVLLDDLHQLGCPRQEGPLESHFAFNRAGRNETILSEAQLVEYAKSPGGEKPMGREWVDESIAIQ